MSPGSARPPGDAQSVGITWFCEVCKHSFVRNSRPRVCKCRRCRSCAATEEQVHKLQNSDP